MNHHIWLQHSPNALNPHENRGKESFWFKTLTNPNIFLQLFTSSAKVLPGPTPWSCPNPLGNQRPSPALWSCQFWVVTLFILLTLYFILGSSGLSFHCTCCTQQAPNKRLLSEEVSASEILPEPLRPKKRGVQVPWQTLDAQRTQHLRRQEPVYLC